MRSKIKILTLLLLIVPSLIQAQQLCVASGGLINCFIPGATITGSGTSQVVTLPGGITLGTTLTVPGAVGGSALTVGAGYSTVGGGIKLGSYAGAQAAIWDASATPAVGNYLISFGAGGVDINGPSAGGAVRFSILDTQFVNLAYSNGSITFGPQTDNQLILGGTDTHTKRFTVVDTLAVNSGNQPLQLVANAILGLSVSTNGYVNVGIGLATTANCASTTCTGAVAGATVIAAAATTATITTTGVTANSQIFIVEDTSLGTRLGVTCNTQALTVLGAPRVTTRTAGTSFVVSIDIAPTTNPMCFDWWIVN